MSVENLNKFGDKLLEYLNSAEIFLAAQMPDFVSQFIVYETWKAEWWFKFCLIFLLIMVLCQLILIITTKLRGDMIGIFMSIATVGTIALFMTVDAFIELKKLELAPKVFMIDKAKALVRK